MRLVLTFVLLIWSYFCCYGQQLYPSVEDSIISSQLNRIEEEFEKGSIAQARNLITNSINFAEKNFGPESPEYRSSIFYLACLYSEEGNYKSAEATYKKTKELFEKAGDSNRLDYAILVREFARFYQKTQRYQIADSLFLYTIDLITKIEGKKHRQYLITLSYRANLFCERGDYETALSIFEKISPKELLQLNMADYMSLLIDMGATYESAGRYQDAIGAYNRCLDYETKSRKNIVPDNSTKGLLAIVQNGLGRCYEKTGNYKKAKNAFSAARGYYTNNSWVNNENYKIFLEDYGNFLVTIGEYKNAEEVYTKLGDLSKNNRERASLYYNSGILQEVRGNYAAAEYFYLEAKKIYEQSPNDALQIKAYTSTLNQLAGLYELIGRYKLSEKLYLQAKKNDELTIGISHPDYAATLNNLAKLYCSMRRFEESEELYQKSLIIIENSLGKLCPNYIFCLSNQALLFQLTGRYSEAENQYKEVLKIQGKLIGTKHPDYATTLNRLAGLYKLMDSSGKAEKLYKKALELRKEIFGTQHPDYAATLNEYAQLFHYTQRPTEAKRLFLEANAIFIHQLKKTYPLLSETERLRFFGKQEPYWEAFYSFASDYLGNFPELALEIQNTQLLIKGLALENTVQSKNIAIQGANDELLSLLEEWNSVCNKISKIYSLSLTEQAELNTTPLDTLFDKANDLEAELSKRSDIFRQKREQSRNDVNFTKLVQKLGPQEAAIDFIRIPYFNGKNYTNEVRYYALISHQNTGSPQAVRLADEAELEQLLNRNMNLRSSNYATSERISYLLYKNIWQPLEPFLGNDQRIYLSAAGLLHKVSFAALMPDSSFLVDKYELVYHSNLRDFIKKSTEDEFFRPDSNTYIFLLGDPDFITPPSALNSQKRNSSSNKDKTKNFKESERPILPINLISSEEKQGQQGHFYRLDGTSKEIEQIEELLQGKGYATKVFKEKTATEEQLKALEKDSIKPLILHIATHGYFFPQLQKEDSSSLQQSNFQNRLRYAANPLWRSGLALAGANSVWRGTAPPIGVEDGVLMSYEVSNLQLFGVKLVVLSACDTGRGDLHNSEGVLGLQRAFKVAGAERLILSLWRVPDAETSELMTLFYRYLLSGLPYRLAFAAAQKEMRKKYAPFYWAGFVLLE